MRGRFGVLVTLFCLGMIPFFPGILHSEDAATAPGLLIKDLVWRNIGPANMGGRISDIQALEKDFRYVIAASASGGVWKSLNAGTTWEPIFKDYGSASIGAVGLFQNDSRIIWVGTGEANVRNSVGWGDGIYKSTDGGQTFTNMGLKDTHHIAKIATHPTDANIAYVAAQGHLWGHTGQRGLFKTGDGGETWQKLSGGLPDDGKTGCTFVIMDPRDPQTLYAAFWERLRRPYRFDSGGLNGGIFKSMDEGRTWKKLAQGLPVGDIGRIGIAVYRKNPKILMAIVEHGFQPRRGSKEYDDLSKPGTGIYRSENGGATWKLVNRYNVRPFYYSQIYINPFNDQLVYIMGTQAMMSKDGGKTLESAMPGIAGDFHVLWSDPQHQDRYYIGNDKGISITHDHGKHFNFFDNFVISQIYQISTDLRDPYYVYIGLQDNGIWGAPSNSRDYTGIRNEHWFKFHSGDGFYTAVDPSDWSTVYTESQGGRIRRNHALFRQEGRNITPNRRNTMNWENVVPKPVDRDHPAVRMNWNTPFFISPHNPHTLYYGANFLFKTIDKGDTWKIISDDLSTKDPIKTDRNSGGLTRDVTSAETHCTIITLSESPLRQGVIWAGTDDGNLQLTRDDGENWTNVRTNIKGVPEGIWVSRVEASHFAAGTCYVTFDGHRSDLFQPFVFKTTDFGETWENITGNIPDGYCTYVIKEDAENKNLLFVGTEFACLVSVDGGKSWSRLMNNLPTVAVHDLVIHPSGDLIAGTHGLGVWILDDITPLQQWKKVPTETKAYLFENPVATIWLGISRGATRGHQLFRGKNPLSMSQSEPLNSPIAIRNSATINYFVNDKPVEKPMLVISDLDGENTFVARIEGAPGINRYRWGLRFKPTESATKAFLSRMERIFKALQEDVEPDRQQHLAAMYKEFKQGETPDEWNRIRRELMQEYWSLGSGRSFFGSELQGPQAGVGAYRIKLTIGDEELHSIVTVREDPLLKK